MPHRSPPWVASTAAGRTSPRAPARATPGLRRQDGEMGPSGRIRNTVNSIASKLAPIGIKPIKRIIVAIVGMTVLLVGVAMIVLPGPAVVVIPLGLAILATEFVWARRLLERVRDRVRRAAPPGSDRGNTREGEDASTSSKTT